MHEEEIRPESSIPSTPLGSRFARLARVAAVTQMMDQVTQPPKPTDDEVEAYMKTFSTKAPPSPLVLVEFWKAQEKEYPELSWLAFDLLAIPATSAAIERVFSQAGLATGGRKCQTGPILLEIECLMKYNKKYFLRLK
uniref:HAT C-terminal dimerisation domain-containing protein n=1 Tax=Plectus sambesii TaxID=2011161 RepID=A0A914UHT2_9BILA